MRFSWEISLCTMPQLFFNNSHIPEKHNTCSTRRCVSNRPPVNAFILVYECVHVFVCLCMGPRGTKMLVCPSAFVLMFLRTFMTFVNALLKCRSPGCAYSQCDAYNVHHPSHYTQLECVHDSLILKEQTV